MDYSKSSVSNLAVAVVLFAGVFYLCSIWPPSASILSATQKCQHRSIKLDEAIMSPPEGKLEIALERASIVNKNLIITVVNKAYAYGVSGGKTMLDLFLEGFGVGDDTRGLVDHLLLVAMDQIAFNRCNFLKLHCYRLETEDVDFGGEKLYMSRDFIKMRWSRTLFLDDVEILTIVCLENDFISHLQNFIIEFNHEFPTSIVMHLLDSLSFVMQPFGSPVFQL